MVVFDIGGVLVRIAPWEEAHSACNFAPDQLPPLDEFLPQLSLLNQAYDRGDLEPDTYAKEVADAAGGSYLPRDVHRIHGAVCTTEYPGLHLLFDELEGAGLAVGVLSNTNVRHWQRLSGSHDGGREYPLISRAHHAHPSFLLKCSKPDPEIYRAFVRKAAVQPGEILFFDDLERNVAAARAMGWRAERIDPDVPTAPQLVAWLQAHSVLP